MDENPTSRGAHVHDVQLTNAEKVLWPAAGITKRRLAEFYEQVGDRLLDRLHDRPVTLNHHPRGVERPGFMRKDLASHAPSFVKRWTMWAPTARRFVSYAVIDSHDTLRWCAGQNVTEFHPCLFRIDRPDRLDTVVIDLDPSDGSVDAPTAALWIREVLDDVGLASWVKTSGGRGLHILIPVERRYSTHALRELADGIARVAVSRQPDELTTEFRIEERSTRLFVDCTRVSVGATLIAAWSPRATENATVATPLEWSEVIAGMDLAVYTQTTVVDRTMPDAVSPQRIDRARSEICGLS